MLSPSNPPNEAARLKALRSLDVLDTKPENRFDRLTRMASRLFKVPIALVSLVDENRQWFKACVGLSVDETPRDISFCGHAVLGDDMFIIEDALEDNRFADNPLVIGPPHIRFYTGCPLRAPNGLKVGTLCIIDQIPRHFSEEDLLALSDLAEMAENELAALYMAVVDELTGISNRRGFMIQSIHSLKLCARSKNPATLIFMDLNKFKEINDSFGHDAGDRVLIVFAELMGLTFRDSDIFARLGGDEFIVFLPNTTVEQAESVLTRFNYTLQEHNKKADFEISFSKGIVAYDKSKHSTIEMLISEGDKKMYQHKKN